MEDIDIWIDKGLLEILLTNIMDNSIKASDTNSRIDIEGSYNKDTDEYTLKIKDKGIGIHKEDLDKVF